MDLARKTGISHSAQVCSRFLAALAVTALLAFASIAEASADLRVSAKPRSNAPGAVLVAARTSFPAKRILFYVDGHRRGVRRSISWRRGRQGLLRTRRLSAGRHRLIAKAVHRSGRVTRATRVIRLAGSGAAIGLGSAQRLTKASQSDHGPEAEDEVFDAGFEDGGLIGWNTAGVGEVIPTVDTKIVRTGSRSGRFVLEGSQDRSELILGGDGTSDHTGSAWFFEGDEAYYAFSFNVQSMVYGHPGAHNLIMQFKGDGDGSPNLGLQLWDYAGDDGHSGGRGLWTHGTAMGGDRFLQPIAHNQWYDVVVHLRASRNGDGFYRVYLNGKLIDSRDNVSTIQPDSSYAYIKTGLYRNGGTIPGHSEIRIDSARLGKTMVGVVPG